MMTTTTIAFNAAVSFDSPLHGFDSTTTQRESSTGAGSGPWRKRRPVDDDESYLAMAAILNHWLD